METADLDAGFYSVLSKDVRIGFTHLCLYTALYQIWCVRDGKTQILMKRHELMELSKIGSSATYHKCVRELVEYGYVAYTPSFNPAQKSSFRLLTSPPAQFNKNGRSEKT